MKTDELQAAVWDTTLPTSNGRRLWHAPALRSHGLLVMTAVRLHLTPSHAELAPTAVRQIEAGAPLEGFMPPATDVVFLPEVVEAKLDLTRLTLRLTTTEREHRLDFADAATADDVFAKLLHRTHRTLTLTTDRPETLRLVRGPIGVMVGILISTLTLALTVSAAADLTSPPGDPNSSRLWLDQWLRLLSQLDWRWVCSVGGASCAWAQLALLRRLRKPPNALILSRFDSPRSL